MEIIIVCELNDHRLFLNTVRRINYKRFKDLLVYESSVCVCYNFFMDHLDKRCKLKTVTNP